MIRTLCGLAIILMAGPSLLAAGAGTSPVGDPVLDPPTLRSLGMYWIIRGDENQNAVVNVNYRKNGTAEWRAAQPLFRVEKGKHVTEKFGASADVPDGCWLFAGSVLWLDPATKYQIKLTLHDADRADIEKTLDATTRSEPTFTPRDAKSVLHVKPAPGGGDGSAAKPFGGLNEAQVHAKPGTIFLLHTGLYPGTFEVNSNGEPGRPIVWRAAGDGEVIFDGQAGAAKRPAKAIAAGDVHDVWFEGLTVRNAEYGIAVNAAARIVIRRCHILGVDYGITSTRNDRKQTTGFFIADNVIEGPSTWPRTKGIEDARGIQITGSGHDICSNRIRGFADAIDTFPSPECVSIDIHNNELSELTDDGAELDFSSRNVRCYENRLTNCFQGISVQPIFGGPVYIVRNAMYNIAMEPLKLHNSPSGVIFAHNTVVKAGAPLLVSTEEPFSHVSFRNNLLIGSGPVPYAFECSPRTSNCDFDYDGFAGGPFNLFLKWNGERYATPSQAREKAPIYKHVKVLKCEGLFASGIAAPKSSDRAAEVSSNDLRLAAKSEAIDAGTPLPNFNDGFSGAGPDLGAYESGAKPPQYGPRPAND